MQLYKYRYVNYKIQKSIITVAEPKSISVVYDVVDDTGRRLPGCYVRKANIDKYVSNLTVPVYLTKEDDEAVYQHFKGLVEKRLAKATAEYNKAKDGVELFGWQD